MMNTITTVPKEAVGYLKFYPGETISDLGLQQMRMNKLLKAERFGNGYQGKVKIIFKQEDEELGMVETTIWATCTTHIVLKGGVIIPIQSITAIEF
jgi:hypothetical protein